MVPVSHPWHDDVGKVCKPLLEWLCFCRRRGRQPPVNISGAYGRRHRKVSHIPHVIGHPIDQLVTVAPEIIGVHRRKVAGRIE